ncbi:ABC transporter ATP-binding protein [Magnetospirillum molischianum]|uniref:Putative Lipid A export ATP-binding/permease protein MsbA n=1 Tax=Magnetospirillum molischianum DSM 120 TaxID=1150626 RepID=H8FXG5_MAGML|nr:ABC transporter ATP-binding protein [Magnetospirillum molischianum]CCG43053.1 putative Lipid A export ATP-binding/permease protein MsbA [Magnetospirillum molischianum DSM 120]
MIKNLSDFLDYFGKGYGRSIILIMIGCIFIAILETFGILLIFPLMALVINPVQAVEGGVLGRIYGIAGKPDTQFFLFMVSCAVGSVYIFKALFQVWFTKWEHSLISRWKVTICYRLFCKMLEADYSYHVDRSSSTIISIIYPLVSNVMNNFMYQFICLATQMIVGIFLCVFMVVTHPVMTLVIAICFSILFHVQRVAIRKRIIKVGEEVNAFTIENLFSIQQGLGAYKETKINLKERFFQNMFLKANKNLMRSEGKLLFYQGLPISTNEMIVMLMVIVAFNMIVVAGNSAASITQDLAVVVMTLFRLIPVVNRSITSVNFINSSTIPLKTLIAEADAIGYRDPIKSDLTEPQALPLTSSLRMKHLSYSYAQSGEPALRDIDFEVKKGEFVGVIGPSGAGKTTLIAILLGFIKPDSGEMTIDGVRVDEARIRAFRHTVGYVDQQPFIFDASIMQNVAFGVAVEDIDRDRVEDALRQAELWDVVSSLEKGIESSVGENGKRFSGGQRQRLAIARALYKQPSILILDEATSALDIDTEQRFSQTIQKLKGSLTIIAIAHRLSTLRDCDRLIMMEAGRIVDDGAFDQLLERNATFRRLVSVSQAQQNSDATTP